MEFLKTEIMRIANSYRKAIPVVLFPIVFQLISSSWAWADPVFSDVKGDVKISRDSGILWDPAAEGVTLADTDQIKTGENSFAEIEFAPGQSVFLRENTLFHIGEWPGKTSERKIQATLEYGNLMGKVKKINTGDSFEIKTPTAIAGVRGTKFYVRVYEKPDLSSSIEREGEMYSNIRPIYEGFLLTPKPLWAQGDFADIITEVFVEEGSVNLESLFSDLREIIGEGEISTSFEDGTIEPPMDAPEDRERDFTEPFEQAFGEGENAPQGPEGDAPPPPQGPAQPGPDQPVTEEEPIAEEGEEPVGDEEFSEGEFPEGEFGPDQFGFEPGTGDGFESLFGDQSFYDFFNSPEFNAFFDNTTGEFGDFIETFDDRNFQEDPANSENQELLDEINFLMDDVYFASFDAAQTEAEDFQTGKVIKDRFGHLIRSDQFVYLVDNEVRIIALNQRTADGGADAGVSGLSMFIEFNDLTGITGTNLQTAIDWDAIFNMRFPAPHYDNIGIRYANNGSPGARPSVPYRVESIDLFMENPAYDSIQITENFTNLNLALGPTTSDLHNVPSGLDQGWYQQRDSVNPVEVSVNSNGPFDITGYTFDSTPNNFIPPASSGLADGQFLTFQLDYNNGGAQHINFDTFWLDNTGQVRTFGPSFSAAGLFGKDANTASVRNMLRPVAGLNTEFLVTPSEFDPDTHINFLWRSVEGTTLHPYVQ